MAEWPLVGRSAELASAVEAVQDARGVVLVGEAGVGKSRLARGVLDVLGDDGWATFWFTAGSSSSAVPFAPFANLLDEQRRDPVERLVRARNVLVGAADRVVIAVDDAHLLDDVSVAFVRGLILDTDVRVVLTVRTGTAAPPVWTGDLARTELHRLGRGAVEELLVAVAGRPVDTFVVRWVWGVTEGNPLFVRELVTDALERNVLTERSGRLVLATEPTASGGRVQEIIAARIGALNDDERVAVELISMSEPVGLAMIESLATSAALQSLERRGLVRADRLERRIELRLAHPLHGEVTRGLLGPSTATSHRRRLLDALRATGARRADDRLQLALWRMENGDVSDWRGLLDAAHELSRASEAVFLADFTPQRRATIAGSDSRELAIRLARAALVASAEAEAAVLLAWMLIRVGRGSEATTVVETLDQLIRSDEDEVMVRRMQADVALMFTGNADAEVARLDELESTLGEPRLVAKARGTRAAILGLQGHVHLARELSLSVYRSEAADLSDRLTAAGLAASALGPCGRSADAFALLDEAQTLVTAEVDSQALAALMIARILLLAIEGRLVEMQQLCTLSVTISDQVGSEDGIAVFSAIGALCAVGGGQLDTALRLADDALRRMVDVDPVGIRNLALTARATALGYLGRADAATIALDDLLLEPRTGLFSTPMRRAKAWVEVANGRTAQAKRTLEDALTEAVADGRPAQSVAVLHDLVRLGAENLGPAAEREAGQVDGPYAPLVLAHIRGVERGTPELVEEAAAGHEAMGAWLYAAECWAHAAGIHRRAGQKARANDAAGRSRAAIARCEGPPSTPALVASEPLGSLTKREQEIVELAAGGLSDKEIAEQLVVSARTVQTHLYNAYAKLGVDGREGLAGY